jgi:UDP-N-acetylmuramyl-tripeptide synthetase
MRAQDLIAGFDIRVMPTASHAGESHATSNARSSNIASKDPLLNVRICDLTEDSRTVMPGSLFVARRGQKTDGRAFVSQAVEAGAVAILTDDPELRVAPPTVPTSPQSGSAHAPLVLFTPDIELATAQIAERFYGDASSRLTLIGVTGTNGKTTTTFLIHQILNAIGIRSGLIGTVCIDDGTEVAEASLTTPPALELSRTFARMVEAGCKAAVMEVSSHALHQRRVGALKFRAGVFTNLTGDHLDYHRTMDAYADAKAMLFASLPSAADGGVAVLNIQDPAHTRMKRDCPAEVYRTAIEHPLNTQTGGGGTASHTVCRARVLDRSTGSTRVLLHGPWSASSDDEQRVGIEVRLPLVGEFNVMNALQAVTTIYALFGRPAADVALASDSACVVGLGDAAAGARHGQTQDGGARPMPPLVPSVSMAEICEALAHTTAPPGRLEPVTREGEGLSVFVDYAHSDDALRTVLNTLRQSMGRDAAAPPTSDGRQLICLFGCGGDRDRTKRPRMGRVAAELADQVIITSDNPRTEDPRAIISEIVEGIAQAESAGTASLMAKVSIEPDRERAIRQAIRKANAGKGTATTGGPHASRAEGGGGKWGDVIIIAGKGHETYQILPDPDRPGQTITRHFDDREVARAALLARHIRTRPVADHACASEDEADASLAAAIDETEALFDVEGDA